MSKLHPVIGVTGSSGAGTSTARIAFEHMVTRMNLRAAIVEGDSFHAYDRTTMAQQLHRASVRGERFSHFGPSANLFDKLEELFRSYGATGQGDSRRYLHTDAEASAFGLKAGTFTPWTPLPPDTDLLLYEGLHGGLVTDRVNVAQHVDLLIGLVPTINLEWIQKIHRDRSTRGYSTEAVTDVILRRMHEYVHFICPQFTRTHINFQRVPVVDTSDPFIARTIPTADESLVVIRFANPRGFDFPYLLSMLHDSFMSRANTLVVPGGKMELAMQLIFTPMVMRFVERRRTLQGG